LASRLRSRPPEEAPYGEAAVQRLHRPVGGDPLIVEGPSLIEPGIDVGPVDAQGTGAEQVGEEAVVLVDG